MHDLLYSHLAPSIIFRCTHPRHNRNCVWSSLLCQALELFRRGRNPMRPTIASALRHVQLVSMDPLPQTLLPACRPGFVSGSDPDTFGFRPGWFRVQTRMVSGSMGWRKGGCSNETDRSKRRVRPSTMGVQGLLPQLRDVARPKHVSEYRGKEAAVDAHGWLHRGAYGCAAELCEGKPTRRCVARDRRKDAARRGVRHEDEG